MYLPCRIAVSALPTRLAVTALFAALALSATTIVPLTAQARVDRTTDLSPADAWDTFTADVTMRRHLLSSSGVTSAEAPAVRYRWTRSQRRGGWTSTVEIADLSAPLIRSAQGRLALAESTSVLRVEDDEDGTMPRVYNRRGEAIRLPSIEDRRVLGEPVAGSLDVPPVPQLAYPDARRGSSAGREWVDAFIAAPAQKQARRAALRHRFGRSPGRVRNLDRFIAVDDGQTLELLADEQTGVPVEINVVRDGALAARSAITYATRTDGTLVRRTVRTEQRVSQRSSDRAVSTIDLANVRLERRGVR
jgi:hypothetical protein